MLTDGRPYIQETLPAWRAVLPRGIELVVVDDSGDPERREWIVDQADHAVWPGTNRCGYNAAMKTVMGLAATSGYEYIWFVEDDFLPLNVPSLGCMQRVLELRPNLSQVALRRQPWYPNEKRAGGVLEAVMLQSKYPAHTNGEADWVEHDKFWTCNPSLWPRWVTERGWPDGSGSERRFGTKLFAEKYKAGYWGMWGDEPLVSHIGAEQNGTGY